MGLVSEEERFVEPGYRWCDGPGKSGMGCRSQSYLIPELDAIRRPGTGFAESNARLHATQRYGWAPGPRRWSDGTPAIHFPVALRVPWKNTTNSKPEHNTGIAGGTRPRSALRGAGSLTEFVRYEKSAYF